MSRRWLWLRYWLIKLVVGRLQVVANTSIYGAVQVDSPGLIWRSVFHCYSPGLGLLDVSAPNTLIQDNVFYGPGR